MTREHKLEIMRDSLLSSAGFFMAWLSVKQVGGQTGDVLGALEQISEILILLTAATLLKAGSQP